MPERLGDLADRFDCELRGDPDIRVSRVATLSNADTDALSFLASDAYQAQLPTTSAAAVVLDARHADAPPGAVLVSPNPYALYARIAAVLHPEPAAPPGVHPGAVVDATATVDASASVGPNAVVAAGARIAAAAVIGAGAYVGPDCVVGEGSRLRPNATLVRAVTLGKRGIIHSGAVIGSDGFGNAMTDAGWLKVPQVGGVVIGDDVEIGANTTVDCGAIDDTVIEDGVRIDNLCMIAHNVRIGAHTAMAATTGIAGSTTIGKRCLFAGNAAAVGHISICDDVVVLGRAVITHDIREPGAYNGMFPAEPARNWTKFVARLRRIDSLQKRVKKLEGK